MSYGRIGAKILCCQRLPHADARLCASLGVPPERGGQSLALVTCDQDDTLYAALDHATKMADVEVVYAKSFYAGSAHASGPLSGEAIGVLAAADPESIEQALSALYLGIDELFAFFSAAPGGPTFFPTVIPSVGEYLAKQAGIRAGLPLGYFIAPPVEALVAMDAALKVADVELVRLFGPPTETNFAGGYVTGTLDGVEAAGRAFADAVAAVAAHPQSPPGRSRGRMPGA